MNLRVVPTERLRQCEEVRRRKRKVSSCRSAMLRQEVLGFIKVISNIEVSPIFLRELKKAVAAGKQKKGLVANKANVDSAPALERPSGVGEARTPRVSLNASKRKAEEL